MSQDGGYYVSTCAKIANRTRIVLVQGQISLLLRAEEQRDRQREHQQVPWCAEAWPVTLLLANLSKVLGVLSATYSAVLIRSGGRRAITAVSGGLRGGLSLSLGLGPARSGSGEGGDQSAAISGYSADELLGAGDGRGTRSGRRALSASGVLTIVVAEGGSSNRSGDN